MAAALWRWLSGEPTRGCDVHRIAGSAVNMCVSYMAYEVSGVWLAAAVWIASVTRDCTVRYYCGRKD